MLTLQNYRPHPACAVWAQGKAAAPPLPRGRREPIPRSPASPITPSNSQSRRLGGVLPSSGWSCFHLFWKVWVEVNDHDMAPSFPTAPLGEAEPVPVLHRAERRSRRGRAAPFLLHSQAGKACKINITPLTHPHFLCLGKYGCFSLKEVNIMDLLFLHELIFLKAIGYNFFHGKR